MYKKNPNIPRDEYIADKIRDFIVEKRLEPGNQLPSIKEFAKKFEAGKETVAGAIELLSVAGLVQIKPRYGVFIIKNPAADFEANIDWETIKNRSIHLYSNPRLRQFLNYLDSKSGDTINLSNPYITEAISPSFSEETLNINNYEPPSDSALTDVYSGNGSYELRVSISEHMASYGAYASPEQIVITSSTRNTVFLLGALLVSKGSSVFYEEYSQIFLQTFLHSLGGNMVAVEMDKHGVKTADLVKSIKEEKKGIFYTCPLFSYPTGITASKTRKAEVLRILSKANIPLIELDHYRELDQGGPAPYYSLDKTSNVIYVGSFEAVIPLELSVSWVVVSKKLIDLLKDLLFQSDSIATHKRQFFVNSILKNGAYIRYLDTLKNYLKRRTEFSDAIMEKHLSGIAEWKNEHPFVYLVKLPFPAKILQTQESALRFLSGDTLSNNSTNYMVISKVNPPEDIYEEAIICLKDLIKKYMRR
jgi:DNA-binding transcriptional MocR family regulator